MKDVMIIDNTSKSLKLNESASQNGARPKYILEGVFTQFNIVNRNNRIYTSENFLPHLNELVDRKNNLGVVYGEFDHPDVFDISMKSLSHTIESASYDANTDSVLGSIRLLNTYYGKEAQSIINDNLPLFVSSRAAGVTEHNNHVSLRKLFTYDIVADPGFASARMNLRSMNESIGFGENKSTLVVDWSDHSVNKLFDNNNNDLVTKSMISEFKQYLDGVVNNLNLKITEAVKNNEDPEKIAKMLERHDSASYTSEQLDEYLNYFKTKMTHIVNIENNVKEMYDKIQDSINSNIIKTDAVKENTVEVEAPITVNTIETLNAKISKLEESLDNQRRFIEYVARKTNSSIGFTENLALEAEAEIDSIKESISLNKEYFKNIFETLENRITENTLFTEYVATESNKIEESLKDTSRFAEYVAINTKEAKDILADNISYTDSLSSHTEDNITYLKYLENVVDVLVKHTDKLTEKVNAQNVNESNVEPLTLVTESIQTLNNEFLAINYISEEVEETVTGEGEDDKMSETEMTEEDQPEMGQEGQEGQSEMGQEGQSEMGQEGQSEMDQEGQSEMDQEGQSEEGQPEITDEPAEEHDSNMTQVDVTEVTPENDTTVVPGEDMPVVTVDNDVTSELTPEIGGDLTNQLDTETNAEDNTVSVETVEGETKLTLGDGKIVKILGTEETGTIVNVDQDGNVTVQLSGTDETITKHRSEIEELNYEAPKTNLMESVKAFINEAKKRKAAEVEVPSFFNFMSESQIEEFKKLTLEKQEEVKAYMEDKEYFTNEDVTVLLHEAIVSKPLTLNERLILGIPEDLKPIWNNLSENVKQSILATSAWFPIKNDLSIEHFWNTRKLESYVTPINEGVSSEPAAKIVFPEDVAFTNEQIDNFVDMFLKL